MDKKDEEMREVIVRLWPIQAKKLLDLLVPPKEGEHAKENYLMSDSVFLLTVCTTAIVVKYFCKDFIKIPSCEGIR